MVFSSPNASSLPTIPHQPGTYFFDSEKLGNPRFARSVQWSLNEYPYLAYSPATVQFHGLILTHLAHNTKKMPMVISVGGYHQEWDKYLNEEVNLQDRFGGIALVMYEV